MPKIPTTTTHRRSLSPSIADKQLHKLFDYMFGTLKARTELEPEIIYPPSDRPQSSSTRRKRNMVINLLKLGRKTKSDYSASSTQAKKSLFIDILKMGNLEKVSDESSDSSFSDSSDGSWSGLSSPDDEDARSTSCHEEPNVEEPRLAPMPVSTSGECEVLSVASPSGPASDAAGNSTSEDIKAENEKKSAALVDLDGDNDAAENPKKPASKTRGSSKRKQSAGTDCAFTPAAQSSPTDHLVVPASASAPAPDSNFNPTSASASDSISAPAPVSGSAPVDPTSDPSTISFPFNHFPAAPKRPAAPRRGLRREHGFYHKSHYEIAWVPEFGDRDAPPRTVEEVLPPWDPSFAPARVSGYAGASSSALPSRVQSPPPRLGAPVVTQSEESPLSTISAMRRSKRRRESEEESVQPVVSESEGRLVRRRRVGLNNDVGA